MNSTLKINLTVFILVFQLLGINLNAQTIDEQYVAKKFSSYYNENMPDSIFSLFDKNMQEAMPVEKTSEFIAGLNKQLGIILKSEFKKHSNQVAIFKTTFEKGVFDLNIAVNPERKIMGLFIKPHIDDSKTVFERNKTKLKLPFGGSWYTFWGGETVEVNYHVTTPAQKGAFDFVIKDESGNSYKNDGTKNEDYFCFEKELIAPCDAEVVFTVDGIMDNKPQELNPTFPTGNTIVLKTLEGEYIFLCHFKQFSIKVKQGQEVKQGDLLGLCGNSGNSSEAHLHFHIQNTENLHSGMGAKCYFDEINVNGELKKDYLPFKGDIVTNL